MDLQKNKIVFKLYEIVIRAQNDFDLPRIQREFFQVARQKLNSYDELTKSKAEILKIIRRAELQTIVAGNLTGSYPI